MKMIWTTILTIFKYGIRTLSYIRIILTNFLFLSFIIIGIVIFLNLNYSIMPSENSALIFDISGIIVDKPATNRTFYKFNQYLSKINKPYIKENSLFDIINILRQAKNDSKITGLILSLKNFSGSNQSSLEHIGKILCEFKKSGKPIFAISDHYNQSQYFLASYANKIYLTPQGSVNLIGMSTNRLYYKSLLDKLKINTYIFRVGTYKSAVEPFIRDNMSDHVRYEEEKWINTLWRQYLHTISKNRNITTQQIFPKINDSIYDLNQMQGNTAQYALKNKWIDEIASYDHIENMMIKIFGYNEKNNSFNSISMYNYNHTNQVKKNNQIAVICINGPITNSTNISGYVNSHCIIKKIREARFNSKIKAIILRINSPGGSVDASDLIRLELIAAHKNSKKPIIVSMGGIAASGGYWIATPADFIIASNSTLTGSIGIFGIINTFENTLDKIGIHSDGANTSPIANITIAKSLPPEYINMMQLHINTNYRYFVETVAACRYKSIQDIYKIAQGRVWLGSEAVKIGLIDHIGDFDDAVKKASELANLTEYQLNWLEEKINWIDLILQQTEQIMYNITTALLINNASLYNFNNTFNNDIVINSFFWNDPKNCYAICPNQIQFN